MIIMFVSKHSGFDKLSLNCSFFYKTFLHFFTFHNLGGQGHVTMTLEVEVMVTFSSEQLTLS